MAEAQQTTREIIDLYEHLDDSLEYVLENVLSEEDNGKELSAEESAERQILEENYNSVLLNPCQCQCDNDAPIKNCCMDTDCCHGGNYQPDAQTAELVLRQEQPPDLIYECGALCKCNQRSSSDNICRNRLVQIGPRRHLQIVDSKVCKSQGLITTVAIPKGAFICEYAGELLTRVEAQRRNAWNALNKRMNYILCLNEIQMCSVGRGESNGRHATFVDPSRRGNIGRYLNHSCAPNCAIYSVRVDCPTPKIAIFSSRVILAGEELCFHYGGGEKTRMLDNSTKQTNITTSPCLCGSENCEKFLPNIDFN